MEGRVGKVQKAIEQLIQEEEDTCQLLDDSFVAVDHNHATTINGVNEAQHRHQLLSQLLTQLESLKDETPVDEMNESTSKVEKVEEEDDREKEEKVVKELKKIQKQNFITHCLLSAMIGITLTWQLSEVSIIWKMKKGINHPFRSIGSVISGWIKGPEKVLNGHECDLNDSAKQIKHKVEAMSLPTIKIPELPHMELPSLDFISQDE